MKKIALMGALALVSFGFANSASATTTPITIEHALSDGSAGTNETVSWIAKQSVVANYTFTAMAGANIITALSFTSNGTTAANTGFKVTTTANPAYVLIETAAGHVLEQDFFKFAASKNTIDGKVVYSQVVSLDVPAGGLDLAIGQNYKIVVEGVGLAGTAKAPGSGTLSITAIPEVSTWLMMLAGFAGLGLVGFRRNKQEVSALTA